MKKNTLLILLIWVNLAGFTAFSQEKDIRIDLGTIKTELRQNAINIGISYIKSLDSLFQSQDIFGAQNNSLFQLTPQFNVQTGTADAFSSITAKLTGILMVFHDTTIAGQITPNTARGFQTFPFSVGFETNNKFNIINGIAEMGWVPWYQTQGNRRTPKLLKYTKFGIFLQGGYKFDIDTDSTQRIPIGGEVDESKEKTDNAIFRAKGSFGIDTKSLFEISGIGIGLIGNIDTWYDFLNSEIYYSINGKLRFYLTESKDKYFDFKYQKGSGAPNFNQGDQFGMGLMVTF